MKIEIGRFYKTRGGLKFELLNTNCPGSLPLYGLVFDNNGNWWSTCLREDGTCRSENDSELDIISEWKEPRHRWLAWLHKPTGKIFMVSEDTPANLQPNENSIRMPHLDEPESRHGK